MIFKKIRFQGDEFILVDGSIATEKQFRNGYSSYAYLFRDGKIMRHGEQIGTSSDIEYLGEVDIEMDLEERIKMVANVLDGNGWMW